MTRTPKIQPPPLETIVPQRDTLMVEERTYTLITPLFGGGVEPQQADPITVVRASEVRGQLRFWWRATRGGRFGGDLAQMKLVEDLLWGAASNKTLSRPSMIQVEIKPLQRGQDAELFRMVEKIDDQGRTRVKAESQRIVPDYAAFPLQPPEGSTMATKMRSVRIDVSFQLRLTLPKQWDAEANRLLQKHNITLPPPMSEVAAALWAWETFGGVGARTRRGFGALCCISEGYDRPQKSDRETVHTWVQAKLDEHVLAGTWPTHVPHLSHTTQFKATTPKDHAQTAWEDLIERLKNFRQRRYSGRKGHPGRSKWPEPDTIRRITRQNSRNHAPTHPTHAFPRAAFGLPIVFTFKDRDKGHPTNRNADPRTTVLQGNPGKLMPYDRLASRLILRPLCCADKKSVGLATILAGPTEPPHGLLLKDAPLHPLVSSALTTATANFDPLNGQTDILYAFLQSLT